MSDDTAHGMTRSHEQSLAGDQPGTERARGVERSGPGPLGVGRDSRGRRRASVVIAMVGMPVLFVLVWSSGFIIGSIGARSASPVTIAFWRFLIAALVLGVISIVTRAPWPRKPATWLHLSVAGVLLQAVQFIGAFYAMRYGVSAGMTSLVTDSTPLFVAALAVPLFSEKLTRTQMIGLLVGFLGVAVAVVPDIEELHSGVIAALVGMAGFATGTLYQKAFGNLMDLRTGTFIQLSAATVVIVPVAAMTDGFAVPLVTSAVLSVVWLALVGSIGAFLLLFLLLRSRPGANATSYLFMVPPTTALIAVPVLEQRLSPASVLGLVLAACGVGLVTWRTRTA